MYLFAWLPFVNPAILWWAAAAATPLIIHLLSKRRYREMQWAAMRYLLAAMRKSSRRIQVEQWILLAIRTLVVLLLVLAIAQPYLEQVGVGLIRGQRTHKVLVLDGSYSMAFRPGEKTLFERAQEVAQEIVEHSGQGDGFTLLVMGNPPRAVVHTPAFDSNDFQQEIASLTLPHSGANVASTLARIEQLLEDARRDVPKLTREEVFILTDLGRSTWVGDVPPEARQELVERSKRITSAGAALVVIDLGAADAENAAITRIASRQPLATIEQEVQIDVQLRNFGRQPRAQQRVELVVDGRTVAEQHVDLAAGAERTVLFTHQFGHEGQQAVEARLAPDNLDLDNHRWLSLPVKEFIDVLCVNGRPTGDPATGATAYLQVALRPSESFRGRAIVRPEIVGEDALQEIPQLARYDCIILSDVRQFIAPEARRLEGYLESGGGLAFFLGPQVQADSYNRMLAGGDPEGVKILPAKLGPILSTPVDGQPPTVDALDYKHPIVEKFSGNPLAGLLQSSINKHFELLLPENAPRPVLGVQGDGALIVAEKVKRGRVVLCGTSADTSWTTLPLLNAYVPLVHEILGYCLSGRGAERNKLVGEPVDGVVRATARQPAGAVTRPLVRQTSGAPPDVEQVGLAADRGENAYSYAKTDLSGIYTVDFPAPVSQRDVFAVNVDTRESDLTKLTEAELSAEVWPEVTYQYWTGRQDQANEPVTEISRRNELHLMLFYAVLALLFVETFLAWKFARHG